MDGRHGVAAGLDAPCAVLDLDDYDANAAQLVQRAAGRPIRVASKSVRCRALLERVLAMDGFSGVLAYAVAEANWLTHSGIPDVYVAYPCADRAALAELADDPVLRANVTVTVDSPETVRFLATAVGPGSEVRVALDVDASLRLGPVHLGARRSPLRSREDALAAASACRDAGLNLVGAMFYDAQVAGIPDAGPLARLVKARSLTELARRRRTIVGALRDVADLEFVNVGGTGSIDRFGAIEDDVITEVAAGSGLYGPHLFDRYHRFTPRPALQLALPVVRRPGPGYVTVFSGGTVASGVPDRSRLPRPVDRGLRLLRSEGAGEVQTPLRGPGADRLAIGDRVMFRPAKAGETLERFDTVHLLRGGRTVGSVPTYRGEGRNFGGTIDRRSVEAGSVRSAAVTSAGHPGAACWRPSPGSRTAGSRSRSCGRRTPRTPPNWSSRRRGKGGGCGRSARGIRSARSAARSTWPWT